MHTMNASLWMDKVGTLLGNMIMIAAIPVAFVATLVQAL